MELRDIRYMLAIAEHLNISRAANVLHVPQPTLSNSLKRLESELGKPLFSRTAKGLVLLPAGKRFAELAQDIVDTEELILLELSENNGSKGTRTLRIGMTLSISTEKYLLDHFTEEFPDVTIEITSTDSASFEKKLLDRQLDIALVRSRSQHTDLAYHLWSRSRSYLLAADDHPICTRAYFDDQEQMYVVGPMDMAGHGYILPSNASFIKTDIENFFTNHNIEYKVTSSVDSLQSAMWLAANGTGLAIAVGALPHTVPYQNLRIFQISEAPIYNLYIAYRRKHKTPAISSFIRFANNHQPPNAISPV